MNWSSILNKYGVDVPNTEQFNILCPLHNDNRQSCSVNLEKGVWICFAGCGQGSLKYLVWKISGKSWKEIQEEFEVPYLDFDIKDFTVEDTEPQETYDQTLYAKELRAMSSNHWIYERGFSADTLEKWGCLENKYNDLVIPVNSPNDDLLGWITRRIELKPKYMFSKGFKKSKTLFGAQHRQEVDTLFVVEGALDAMWLDQHGYPSVAVLGAIISPAQINLLGTYNSNEIVLCLDNDDAGKKGIAKATIDMGNRFMLSYVEFPTNRKDFQEIRDPKDLENVINNRSIWQRRFK